MNKLALHGGEKAKPTPYTAGKRFGAEELRQETPSVILPAQQKGTELALDVCHDRTGKVHFVKPLPVV